MSGAPSVAAAPTQMTTALRARCGERPSRHAMVHDPSASPIFPSAAALRGLRGGPLRESVFASVKDHLRRARNWWSSHCCTSLKAMQYGTRRWPPLFFASKATTLEQRRLGHSSGRPLATPPLS